MQEVHTMGNRIAESIVMERRITLRLLGYWEKLRGERTMPMEAEIVSEDIQDLWDSCMLLHATSPGGDDFRYSYIGEAIREIYRSDAPEVEQGSLADFNADSILIGCQKVMDTKRPLLDEGEFYNAHNELVKYRLCLLPLGDGQIVRAIFGGMRFKVYHN